MYLHLIPTEFFYICLYFIPQIVKSLNWILIRFLLSLEETSHFDCSNMCWHALSHLCWRGWVVSASCSDGGVTSRFPNTFDITDVISPFFQHFFSFDNIMFCRFFSCKHYFWLYFQFGKLIFPYQGSGPNFWIQSLNLDIDINPFLLLQSAVPVCCLF